MSAAVLAVIVVPILIRWTFMLADRPSEVKDKFLPSPPLRALYPGGLIMFGWASAFEAMSVVSDRGRVLVSDLLGLILTTGFLTMTVLSWPVTVQVSQDELTWHHLLRRHRVPWKDVQDVNTDMSTGLIIYLSGDRRIEVGRYTEGRRELRQYILRRIGRPDLEAL